MDETDLPWSTENVWANCVSRRGQWNTEDMLKLGADKYPAAKWCVEHGEGWYMPSSYEMGLMWTAVSNGTHAFDKIDINLTHICLTNDFSTVSHIHCLACSFRSNRYTRIEFLQRFTV